MFGFLGMFNDIVSKGGTSVTCTIREVQYVVSKEGVFRTNSSPSPVPEEEQPLYTSLLMAHIRERGSVYR